MRTPLRAMNYPTKGHADLCRRDLGFATYVEKQRVELMPNPRWGLDPVEEARIYPQVQPR